MERLTAVTSRVSQVAAQVIGDNLEESERISSRKSGLKVTFDEDGADGTATASQAPSRSTLTQRTSAVEVEDEEEDSKSRIRMDDDELDLLMFTYGLTGQQIAEEMHGNRVEAERRMSQAHGIRASCFRASQNFYFRFFFAVLVVANIVFVAVQADLQASAADDGTVNLGPGKVVVDNIFAALFLIEVAIRTIGSPVSPWEDKWLMTDTAIAFASILDVWVLDPLDAVKSVSSISSFRSLRVLRVLRVNRITRILRFLRPLRVMAEALGEAFQRIAWVGVTIFLATYSVAVVFTSTIGGLPAIAGEGEGVPDSRTMFGSVGSSILSLNLVLLHGIEWGRHMLWPMLHSDMPQYVMAGIGIVAFNLFSSVCLLNLISGVFVSSILDAAKRDTAMNARKSLVLGDASVHNLRDIYRKMDTNNDTLLTWDEFKAGLVEHPSISKKLGLTVTQADALFRQLDHDKSGLVTIDEFLVGLLKHIRTSKTIQMLCMDHQQRKSCRELYKLEGSYDRDVQLLRTYVRELGGRVELVAGKVTELADDLRLQAEQQKARGAHVRPLQRSPLGTEGIAGGRVMNELEKRFNFKTRLESLERRTLSHLVPPAPASASQDSAAGSGGQPAAWHELMFDEVMPWLEQELAKQRNSITRSAQPVPMAAPASLRKRAPSSPPACASTHAAPAVSSRPAAVVLPPTPVAKSQRPTWPADPADDPAADSQEKLARHAGDWILPLGVLMPTQPVVELHLPVKDAADVQPSQETTIVQPPRDAADMQPPKEVAQPDPAPVPDAWPTLWFPGGGSPAIRSVLA